MDENSLKHYGILGMKWGIRRYQNYDGTYTKAGKKRRGLNSDSDSNSTPQKTDKQNPGSGQQNSQQSTRTEISVKNPKPASEMTDQELRTFLNRIDMEKKYNAYINPEPKPKEVSAGRKFVNDVLSNSAKNVAQAYVTAKLTDLVFGKKEDKSDKGSKGNKDLNKRLDELEKLIKGNNSTPKESAKKSFGEGLLEAIKSTAASNAEKRAAESHRQSIKNAAAQNAHDARKRKRESEARLTDEAYSYVSNFLQGASAARAVDFTTPQRTSAARRYISDLDYYKRLYS